MCVCVCVCVRAHVHTLHTWALAIGLPGLACKPTTPTMPPPTPSHAPSPGLELVGRPPAYRFVCADGVHLGPKHH